MNEDQRIHAILEQVRTFCREEGLLMAPGGPLRLAAAVSGGADSMALLRILLCLQPEFGFVLTACHVNHGLRGETADRDEAFVRAECARLGVELRVFHPEDAGMAVPSHAGEDWARRLRYTCFDRLRTENGISRVATAHTATDQAETLLFRLARGTGLHGAGGIRPLREGFCRPLLILTREDTEYFCRTFGQGWVTDETNHTDAYARNRLRHRALPVLQSVNSGAEQNLARFCEKAARADAYFARQAERLLEKAEASDWAGQAWQLDVLQQADPLVLEAALHQLVSPERDAEEKYIRLLAETVERGRGGVQVTGRVRFCAAHGLLRREEAEMLRREAPEAGNEERFQLPFCPQKEAEYPLPGGWKLKTRIIPAGFEEKTQGVHKKDLKNRADYAKIMMLYPALCLRCRQPRDRFRPAGRGVTKELRRWMNEEGVPPPQRSRLPLLAAGSEVVWVRGGGFADGLAPGSDAADILELEMVKTEE